MLDTYFSCVIHPLGMSVVHVIAREAENLIEALLAANFWAAGAA